MGESLLKYPFWEFGFFPVRSLGTIFIHIITAGLLAYFIKKNKPILGLVIAIAIHNRI